ncbi:CBS domain-containing protein [Corallincola luteus]|uniref:CBS domain-containing protein n=1 Tax=Corallincola luteus TaxID=1775177 RepID=A0ABY2AJA8_9GAMM|nr:CBS domain-containing protein [Corallincola luteus]TCI02040.1 CBS domain-containing protein [Corallincola luteus]
MFYIYSPQGRIFSGTLEMLKKVEAVSDSAKGEVRQEFMLQQEIEASVRQNMTPAETQEEEKPYQAPEGLITKYNQVLKSQGQREPVYHVYQVMSRPVVSVTPDFSIERLFQTFEQYPYKLFPVVTGNQLIAAISRAQLYHLMLTNPEAAYRESTLAMLLDTGEQQVLTADPVTDIRRAARVMLEEKLEALPVVDSSGQVQGIISRTDILHCVVKDPPLSIWT